MGQNVWPLMFDHAFLIEPSESWSKFESFWPTSFSLHDNDSLQSLHIIRISHVVSPPAKFRTSPIPGALSLQSMKVKKCIGFHRFPMYLGIFRDEPGMNIQLCHHGPLGYDAHHFWDHQAARICSVKKFMNVGSVIVMATAVACVVFQPFDVRLWIKSNIFRRYPQPQVICSCGSLYHLPLISIGMGGNCWMINMHQYATCIRSIQPDS